MVTFPFLFAIMFGDIGHGAFLFFFAAYLCLREETIRKERGGGGLLKTLLPARYLILMSGFFAVFTGFIYNDFMSIPIFASWGSCWKFPGGGDAQRVPGCVPPFGIDPIWYESTNQLTFLNNFKMKLAVIFAIL